MSASVLDGRLLRRHVERRADGYVDRGVLREHLRLPTGIKGYNAE